MQWFRMYYEFATDPKVQAMSEPMQRRLVMLFCLKGSGQLDSLSHDEIAFSLRIDSETLHETFHVFHEKGFCDKFGNIINWDKRQYKSDISTTRVKKFREKTTTKKNETKLKRFRNITVTSPDTDTDTDNKNIKEDFVLPDWVPKEEWDDYLEMRKLNRKQPTLKAKKLIIKKLAAMKANGQNISEVLNKSTRSSWIDVFEIKPYPSQTNQPPAKKNVVTL